VEKREYKVLAPIPKANGGEWFMLVGRAYENSDSSINLYVDAIPTASMGKGLKLQVRALDEEDLRRREAYRASASSRAPNATVHANVHAKVPSSAPAQDSIPF
jgi:hypothetical protein